MGRKKEEVETQPEDAMAKSKAKASKFIEKFRQTNKLASILTTSRLSNITDYVSSGCYALNKVISGSFFKGWPTNRVMVICGPSSCGKTFVCLSTAREAQKKGYQVVYFDSENAIDAAFARNLGVDPDSLIHIPVKTISQFRNEAVKFMREWRADPDTKDIPLVMFIDSIGNLVGTKEMNDVEAEKSASDMGQRAKELRACARVLTMECAENEVLLLGTNHTYEVQNMMGAPTIKMGGGEGFVYASSGIVILQSKAVKEDEGKDSEGRKIMTRVANIVVATSEKNRLVPVGMRGYVYIDFKRGVNPNYGMLDDALKYGLIEQKGAWYTIKDKDGNDINKVQKKTLYSKEVWDAILPALNEKLEEDMKYSTFVSGDANYVLEEDDENEESPPEKELE